MKSDITDKLCQRGEHCECGHCADARDEIATLRKQLEVATKALNKVHKWQRGEGLLVSVAAAMSDVLADPALRAMVKGEA